MAENVNTFVKVDHPHQIQKRRCKSNPLNAAPFRSKLIKYRYEHNTKRNKMIKKIDPHFGKSCVVIFCVQPDQTIVNLLWTKKWMNGTTDRAPMG